MPARLDTITSPGNPWLKTLRRAAARGSTTPEGFALAESPHLLQEALRSGIEIDRVFASERAAADAAAALPPHLRVPLHPVADRLFEEVSTTASSQGVLALVKLPAWEPPAVFGGLVVALDRVQDPGNAGMIVRSAEAFGASGVVFLKGSAAPTNPKALRAAAGSAFRLPLLQRVAADAFLTLAEGAGKTVLCTGARAEIALADADLSTDCVVVVGSEGRGVGAAVAARATAVGIPVQTVDSLNASVAASIVLYEFARRRLAG